MPTSANLNPTWRYRFGVRLVSPLLVLHSVWRGARDGGWLYTKERFGFVEPDSQARIHIHAASVGEVMTVLPFIEALQEKQPELSLLVTTNTPTGAAILNNRLAGNADYAFLPIDFAGATARFYNRKNISELWVVETEIWPWLYARAKQKNIGIKIINGRLSHKSQGAIARFFNETYAKALSGVTVFARSDDDAQRYIERGAEAKNVSSLGNLKLAHMPPIETPEALLTRDYMLAASTHDDEEIRLAQAWLDATDEGLLVIAPRHVERGARLSKGLHVLQTEYDDTLPAPAIRSLNQLPTPNCRLYIADTLGELQNWYAFATAAFVGGSLIPRGGHNVLEPARVNAPIIVGPHTFNFVEEVTSLKAVNAIAVANNADEVIALFALANSKPEWAKSLSDNALAMVEQESGVLEAYCAALS